MGIPGPLMPGMGGPPPAPMSGPGLPGGPPDPVLSGLAMLQQAPPPDGEKEALRDATLKINMAMSRIQLRSPKAAAMLANAVGQIQKAMDTLQEEGSKQLPPPPDLGLSGGAIAGNAGAQGPF